ncbi:chemotaxis protein CheW [Oscillatoria sp. FACHB-1407]|uniref:chemotaxis protein CheW n=1 Tax=Oscillatoria sp. FACHB-1407 TaxID=2692847 RepID=UPI0016838E05|nr:chemotaxis protein CheW [Oscillatoria sp. FACHB-1407]MBD2461383.1 chemotaxis protein CheW [Oscillatoria sp. FACHB-1407]
MSNTLIVPSTQSTTALEESCKAIVFAIANQLLALPLSAIVKVIYCSVELSHSIHNQELILFDHQPLTVLNLHSWLASTAMAQGRSPIRCLIIAQAYQDLYAIPVDRPPTLQELPLADIQPLPVAYSKAIAQMADHFALVNQQDVTHKILLLDLHQAAHLNAVATFDEGGDESESSPNIRV